MGALEMKLTPDDLRRIDEALPRGIFSGERYPEGTMRLLNR